MPANQKVSVAWQIVFTFLPVVNFWAFYRIRKLRKYLLYVFVPSIALTVVLLAYYYSHFGLTAWGGDDQGSGGFDLTGPTYEPYNFTVLDFSMSIFGSIIGWGLQGFAIYLVIIWSRLHNQTFDTPPSQSQP